MADNTRDIEAGIHEDFREEMSYGSYLALGTLLDAQRTLVQAEAQLAQSDALVTTYQVALFKALAGGWTSPQV